MPLFNVPDLLSQLAPGQRLIGLDLGAKRVGVALSDVSRTVATPHGILPRGKLLVLAASLGELVRAEGVGGLVVGLPLSMDGAFGPAAQAARDVTHALSRMMQLPAALWDERLSSAAVNRMLIDEADATRRQRAAAVDALAAAYILQAALDQRGSDRVVS